MTRESEIERHFVRVVQAVGGKSYKFKSLNNRGVTDRIACLPNGATWFVELKQPKGALSKLQELFSVEMWKLKQRYACLWTKEGVDIWIRDAMK